MRTPHTPKRGAIYESVPQSHPGSFRGGRDWEVVGKSPDGRYRLRLLMARRNTFIRRTGAELADPYKWTAISPRDLSPEAFADSIYASKQEPHYTGGDEG